MLVVLIAMPTGQRITDDILREMVPLLGLNHVSHVMVLAQPARRFSIRVKLLMESMVQVVVSVTKMELAALT